MNVRQWLRDNPNAAAVVVALLLAGAIGAMVLQTRDLSEPQAYFMDLGTGELFTHPRHAVPPVPAPSGDRGVRARLFSCGACEPNEWFGYLETYTEQARRLYEEEGIVSDGEGDFLLRDLQGDHWVPEDSEDAEVIRAAASTPCPGGPDRLPEPCVP